MRSRWHIFLTSVPMLVVMLTTLVSLSMDIHLLRMLHSRVTNASMVSADVDRAGYLRVPVRCTLFSAATLLPLLFFFLLKLWPARAVAQYQQPVAYAMMVTGISYTVFRAPLAAMLTFRWRKKPNDINTNQVTNNSSPGFGSRLMERRPPCLLATTRTGQYLSPDEIMVVTKARSAETSFCHQKTANRPMTSSSSV